jgi:integrase
MKTKHAPYSLYKKRVGTGFHWYVRFWDFRERRYSLHRATGIETSGKKGRKGEAEQMANNLLSEVGFNACGQGMLRYLKAFWQADSQYFKEAEIQCGRKLSEAYIAQSSDMIRLHIEHYKPFQGITLSGLTSSMVKDFMVWGAERGMSNMRINRALQVMRVPLRYAVSRGEIKTDPFLAVKNAHEAWREKGVLTVEELKKLLESPVEHTERRLCVLLGMLCGLRIGEARGLQWGDLDEDILHIKSNYQPHEGLKGPKFDSYRNVPLPKAARHLLVDLKEARGKDTGFVFQGSTESCPRCLGFFRNALIAELEGIGISLTEQRRRNITFHSLRHCFVSINRLAGLNDFIVQSLAGHKSSKMMERYSHANQVIRLDICGQTLDKFLVMG